MLEEAELGGLVRGEGDLGVLDGLMELVAEVFVDEGDEGFDLLVRVGGGAEAGAAEDLVDVAGAEEGEVVPALEVGVDPGGDGGQGLAERVGDGVGAEGGRDEMADEFGVEGVAGEAEAGGAEDAFGRGARAGRGADVDESEVGGAAAEVADEDELVAGEGGLVGEGGGDGSSSEVDVFEAGGVEAEVRRAMAKASSSGVVAETKRTGRPMTAERRGSVAKAASEAERRSARMRPIRSSTV